MEAVMTGCAELPEAQRGQIRDIVDGTIKAVLS